jgi:hypothetical protein
MVDNVVHSSGRPLDPSVREYMEVRFGCHFGDVRVHADARASYSTEAVNARAYTVGNHRSCYPDLLCFAAQAVRTPIV